MTTSLPIPSAGVYAIENTVNGRIYVGSSVNVEMRMHHRLSFRRGSGSSTSRLILADLKVFGVAAFRLTILQRTYEVSELKSLEQRWADQLGAFEYGYNVRRMESLQLAQAPA
ncbi:endonuclease (plasmid) [Deinococcus psychrotolerans]|uniref:Endonuclease n=1 Tax=Deinococcus psychrotolerans TaxID=2489213 RepID=A0A3G8YKU8_9DEIO|nr:GIY-YIG nuclease family protein [Deinococcus psychrotolerans]AZI45300.1 endonuclease [Deinococcus psychrotolerans]